MRLAAVSRLVAVYRTSHTDPEPLHNFTHRFEKRGVEEQERAEVCSAAQSEGVSEEVGAMGGERLGLLGRLD